ncbi:PPC domain-containing protein [Brevundimonas sp.]|uniref:PPC domain-containing protein n=1 Tax=Brevundimonas sp. TaxID=1871086 RepID=UPI00261E07B3|nr:PPC domain-containing protein [Brevundimonas sp.]
MTRSFWIAGAALSALALAAVPASAQSLQFGAPAAGELSADDPLTPDGLRHDDWRFSTRDGQRVELTLHSEAFDAWLEVWPADADPEAGPVQQNDDGLSGTDSRLRYTASGGDWIARVRAFDGEATGAYVLTLTQRPPAPRAPRPTATRIGATVNGQLSDRDPETVEGQIFDAYRLRLRAGERLLLTLTSDAFDPVVRIGTQTRDDFAELAMNDDDGAGLNSRLVFEAPSTGDYVIRVSPLAEGQGDYVLTLAEAPPPAAAEPLAFGAPAAGTLDFTDGLDAEGRQTDAWVFQGTAGMRVQIDMTSGDFDTYVVLLAESDPATALAEDDDGGPEGTNSRLFHTLPADGAYRIQARSFAPGGTGAYDLTVIEAEPERPAQALAFGETLQGDIEAADPLDGEGRNFDAFVFTGAEGQRIQAIGRSGDFDVYLRIGSADGEFSELASDDDGLGQGTDSRLNFTLPADGDYVMRLSPLGADEDGLYSLELIDRGPKPAPGSLVVGASVRGTLTETDDAAADGSWFDSYAFHAKAGESLTVTLAANAFDAFIIVGREKADGEFEVLGSDDDSLSDTHARLEWEAPEDGTYVIRAGSFGPSEAGAYVLRLEPTP